MPCSTSCTLRSTPDGEVTSVPDRLPQAYLTRNIATWADPAYTTLFPESENFRQGHVEHMLSMHMTLMVLFHPQHQRK